MSAIESIWARTTKAGPEECWAWNGPTGQRGQPGGSAGGRGGSMRRILWELVNGRPLTDKERVTTTCKAKLCMNPAHFALTPWHDDEARFWRFVTKGDGCWEWTGALFNNGYPAFRMGGGARHAHRVAWEFANGPIVGHVPGDAEKEIVVMHKCDNPKCVRADHLELGSDADNIADMWRKGRAFSQKKRAATDKRSAGT